MTLKIRRLIFYSLIIIFLALAFVTIPYSYGWRFDAKTFSLVKSGGIYLEINPADSQTYLNGEAVPNKSGFGKKGILISDLLPKTYNVSVQKEGYQNWSKNLTVKASLVTRPHPIVLLAQKPGKELVDENAADIFPGANYLIWKSKDGDLKIGDKS